MDISAYIAPKSDQLNADDLLTGPMTVTVKDAAQAEDNRVSVHTEETPGRPYKPSKSMLRVIAKAWGNDSTAWTGGRLTLYRNPTIKFGREEVGGIEISHMTGIDGEFKIPLTVTRGKKKLHMVKPLAAQAAYTPSQDWLALIKAAETHDEKIAVGQSAKADGAPNEYMDLLAKELS